MTKDQDDLIKEYLAYGQESTFGVDPAWDPNINPWDPSDKAFKDYILRPRSHSMKFDVNFDINRARESIGYPPVYKFKMYDLIEYQIYTPKAELLGKVWAMPAEGFND